MKRERENSLPFFPFFFLFHLNILPWNQWESRIRISKSVGKNIFSPVESKKKNSGSHWPERSDLSPVDCEHSWPDSYLGREKPGRKKIRIDNIVSLEFFLFYFFFCCYFQGQLSPIFFVKNFVFSRNGTSNFPMCRRLEKLNEFVAIRVGDFWSWKSCFVVHVRLLLLLLSFGWFNVRLNGGFSS